MSGLPEDNRFARPGSLGPASHLPNSSHPSALQQHGMEALHMQHQQQAFHQRPGLQPHFTFHQHGMQGPVTTPNTVSIPGDPNSLTWTQPTASNPMHSIASMGVVPGFQGAPISAAQRPVAISMGGQHHAVPHFSHPLQHYHLQHHHQQQQQQQQQQHNHRQHQQQQQQQQRDQQDKNSHTSGISDIKTEQEVTSSSSKELTAEQHEQHLVALTIASMQPGTNGKDDGHSKGSTSSAKTEGQQQQQQQKSSNLIKQKNNQQHHSGDSESYKQKQHQRSQIQETRHSEVYTPPQTAAGSTNASHGSQDTSAMPTYKSLKQATTTTSNELTPHNDDNTSTKQEQVMHDMESYSNGTLPPHRRLKVEDALSYLDGVKSHFGSQPDVYNSFLNIMKDFKSQAINTPEVIKQVSELFKGHPELVVGFNTFLPPGYKIEIPDVSQPENIVVSQPRKQVEFSHAIQYVNKIKTRFQSSSNVYKTFRQILDTYQKEQKTITEVYEQLAELFKNHVDLLEEFSQFLPEAIPAAKAYKERMLQEATRTVKRKSEVTKPVQRRHDNADDIQPPKRTKEATSQRQATQPQLLSNYVLTDELQFFDNVKRRLQPRPLYDDFLRCLNLYSHGIITRDELVTVGSVFLEKFPDLLRWFRRFLGVGDSGEVLDPHRHDIDLNACVRIGVSYRRLPDEFQHAHCSGRDQMNPSLLETLNNRYVSFPSWTSEDNQFVTGKKTQYEDALFRAEDERFELDMLLATNQATLTALRTCYKECQAQQDRGEAPTLDTERFGTNSSTIHHRCLKRLYGSAVDDILKAMKNSPIKTLSIVIARLSQKQKEWKDVQFAWNREWKTTFEENYLRALDQVGLASKKKDLAELKPKAIRQSFKEMAEERAKYFKRIHEEKSSFVETPPHARRTFKLPKANAMNDFEELFKAFAQKQPEKSFDRDRVMLGFKVLAGFIQGDDISELVDLLFVSVKAKEDETEANEIQGNGINVSTDPSSKCNEMDTEEDRSLPSDPRSVPFHVSLPTTNNHAITKTRVLYTSTKWAIAFVLFETIYERIASIKEVCDQITEASMDSSISTADLDPAVALAVTLEHDVPKDQYFDNFKECTKELINNPGESNAYEEAMRKMFITRAHKLYSIDRLMSFLHKQMVSVVQDHVSLALLRLHQDNLTEDVSTSSAYYRQAIQLLEDPSSLYCVTRTENELLIELIGEIKPSTAEDIPQPNEAWASYVESFIKFDHNNEGLLKKSTSKPFLERCRKKSGIKADNQFKNAGFLGRLSAKFALNDFALHIAPHSWEVFARPNGNRVWSEEKHVKSSAKFRSLVKSKLPTDCATDDDILLQPSTCLATQEVSFVVNGVTVRKCISKNSSINNTSKDESTTSLQEAPAS